MGHKWVGYLIIIALIYIYIWRERERERGRERERDGKLGELDWVGFRLKTGSNKK